MIADGRRRTRDGRLVGTPLTNTGPARRCERVSLPVAYEPNDEPNHRLFNYNKGLEGRERWMSDPSPPSVSLKRALAASDTGESWVPGWLPPLNSPSRSHVEIIESVSLNRQVLHPAQLIGRSDLGHLRPGGRGEPCASGRWAALHICLATGAEKALTQPVPKFCGLFRRVAAKAHIFGDQCRVAVCWAAIAPTTGRAHAHPVPRLQRDVLRL